MPEIRIIHSLEKITVNPLKAEPAYITSEDGGDDYYEVQVRILKEVTRAEYINQPKLKDRKLPFNDGPFYYEVEILD